MVWEAGARALPPPAGGAAGAARAPRGRMAQQPARRPRRLAAAAPGAPQQAAGQLRLRLGFRKGRRRLCALLIAHDACMHTSASHEAACTCGRGRSSSSRCRLAARSSSPCSTTCRRSATAACLSCGTVLFSRLIASRSRFSACSVLCSRQQWPLSRRVQPQSLPCTRLRGCVRGAALSCAPQAGGSKARHATHSRERFRFRRPGLGCPLSLQRRSHHGEPRPLHAPAHAPCAAVASIRPLSSQDSPAKLAIVMKVIGRTGSRGQARGPRSRRASSPAAAAPQPCSASSRRRRDVEVGVGW
jgi:hypothetical protein